MVKALLNWGNQNITRSDVLWAVLFIVVFTLQPQYANGPLNLFELGLYLPSIDGVLHGLVPFRDFFYLRGPLEIYIPSLVMKIFGENVSCLSLYFYIGNVLCLVMACLIGSQLLRTRFIFYAFIPSLAARTFPRVVFAFWGGMRYVWGLLFVYLMLRAFKTQRGRFFFFAGLAAACAALTSIEIGVCCFWASLVVFLLAQFKGSGKGKGQVRLWGLYALGGLAALVPCIVYFMQVGAMLPFIEDMQAVIFKSHPTFMTQLTSTSPRTPSAFLHAMIPAANNFKYMTPLYCFLLMTGVLIARWRRKTFTGVDFALTNLLVYAVVLYFAAFRIIEGGQFETALQVEKILYFVVIEAGVLWLMSKYRAAGMLFLAAVLGFSWGYAIDRYYKRSPITKKTDEASMLLTFERAQGVRTSIQQAQELETLVSTVAQYTNAQDKIFVYPDMGSYYFLSKRGFVGRFPTGTLAWMREDWHRELMQSLNTQMPKIIILTIKLDDDFTQVYFKRPSNEEHFKEVQEFVYAHYDLIKTTPFSGIFLKKE